MAFQLSPPILHEECDIGSTLATLPACAFQGGSAA